MSKPKISTDGRVITVRVPISIWKRDGRTVLASGGVGSSGRKCQFVLLLGALIGLVEHSLGRSAMP